MSAVFRKGGDVTFIVDEMKAVFDPKGGYFKAGGVYMPSLVAELGSIVEAHLKSIGLLQDPELSAAQKALIADKRRQYDARSKTGGDVGASALAPQEAATPRVVANSSADHEEDVVITGDSASFPPSASLCGKCNTQALVILDGCATCLNCGYSKCG